jgi:hypothetical protein
MKRLFINHLHVHGDYIAGDYYDIHDNPNASFNVGQQSAVLTPCAAAEDVAEVDTSFFCTQQFAVDIIEKNLRQAIELASSKADACRRVMALEPLGYVVLSNVTDERKAELVNPFAIPRFRLSGEDFRKARNT